MRGIPGLLFEPAAGQLVVLQRPSLPVNRSGHLTCSAINPPIALLILANFPTELLMKASKSSIDSGRGSGGSFGAAGAGGGTAAGVEAEGDARVCCRAGTACGSSTVEEAMSSRRAVAASSLPSELAQNIDGLG